MLPSTPEDRRIEPTPDSPSDVKDREEHPYAISRRLVPRFGRHGAEIGVGRESIRRSARVLASAAIATLTFVATMAVGGVAGPRRAKLVRSLTVGHTVSW